MASGATAQTPPPDGSAEPDRASAFLGWSVASAGDVDGDGYDDVLPSAAASRVLSTTSVSTRARRSLTMQSVRGRRRGGGRIRGPRIAALVMPEPT